MNNTFGESILILAIVIILLFWLMKDLFSFVQVTHSKNRILFLSTKKSKNYSILQFISSFAFPFLSKSQVTFTHNFSLFFIFLFFVEFQCEFQRQFMRIRRKIYTNMHKMKMNSDLEEQRKIHFAYSSLSRK